MLLQEEYIMIGIVEKTLDLYAFIHEHGLRPHIVAMAFPRLLLPS
jgi:hypothetical protein